ncbi:hypothetical protein [Mycobacteroides abscessus]|uniref:hypothetical protein n=1 Tax=Mycobacteroides abscessus TaxID=36809 RepID=UPI0021062798|nr:hypothetical protein [Mycobacteroides abscessus]
MDAVQDQIRTEALTKDGSTAVNIIRDLRRVGIEIPTSVESELNLFRSVRETERQATAALQDAQSRMRTCSPDEWDENARALSAALTTWRNLENGLTANLLTVASNRFTNTAYGYAQHWSAQLVVKLNELVESTGWNTYVKQLPSFERGLVRVLSLTTVQSTAVEACLSAVDEFNPLWSLLVRLNNEIGYEVAAGPAEHFSANVNLFYVLSEGDWGQAQGAASRIAGSYFLSDQASEYKPLLPYIFPALVGADLNFATPAAARGRRANRQHGGSTMDAPILYTRADCL